MKRLLLRSLIFLLVFGSQGMLSLQAQTTAEDISRNLSEDPRVSEFTMDPLRGTPSMIHLNTAAEQLSVAGTPAFLTEVLGHGQETSFVLESSISNNGVEVTRFQQYTNGIKVEHGVFKAISKKGVVLAFTAEYYNLPAEISSAPGLSENEALQQALIHIGATTYAWELVEELPDSPEKTAAYEEVYPKGQLVFVDNYATADTDVSLAWKFNIYAAEPLSRDYVYVDAATGNILLTDAIIKHASGIHSKEDVVRTATEAKQPAPSPVFLTASGDTRYAGNRNFDTSLDANGNYVLKGITPSGVENETLSFEGIGGLPLSIPALTAFAEPIADGDGDLLHPETADNNWTAAEHRKDNFSTTNIYPIYNERNNDDVALDAHWGAEVVLDYWKNKHNRSSYDNLGTKVLNFVHYGDAYDNAFWNGSSMTYGDGSYQGGTHPDGVFAPLTSMDVCAHEIAHGVCEYTANLVYQRESGAMNEGFSDIWAAAVEYYVLSEIDGSLNYDPWGIGEQIDERDGGLPPGEAGSRALRWMDDPKAVGDPDSYGGENWINPECGPPNYANDQCGVHTNSGVLNKWYYFLVTGSGQAFSPGYRKQAADDQVTDAGNSYSVKGIGFEKASQIAYIAETMLAPNSKFADMRAASILVAQTLYGIASPEEAATTNAWHAVDIGSAFNAGEPNSIVFSDSNVQLLTEDNLSEGCEDFNTYTLTLIGTEVSPAANISLSLAGSTATLGEDFDLSTQELSFSGTGLRTVEITLYDDAVIEGSEKIVLSFVHNGELRKQEYGISDNDIGPRTGTEAFELLSQDFSGIGIPEDWSVVSFSDGGNTWKANGNLTAAGKAYVTDGISDLPVYNQLEAANVILRSPLINASGATQVTVSFDWEAGGETDVDPSILYDYGEFVYSLDGVNYISVETFVGDAAGAVPASGTFTLMLPQLEGKAFYLGWRWISDSLAGTEFTFTVDNVSVTALPAGIETQAQEQATATVNAGTTVYFLSESDQQLIAKIENASADLGCVTLTVIEEGTGFEVFSNISTARPSKAFSISTANPDASYDITLYFTNEELRTFDVPAELIPILVRSENIDDASEQAGNFKLDGALTDINTEGEFYAYTANFSGSGSLSVVKDFDSCIAVPSPWNTADIGNTSVAGEVCYDEGRFETTAAGTGIQGKADGFHFTYQEFTGDVEIIARVSSLETGKAAVMLRESLSANSAFAMTTLESGNSSSGLSASFQYRRNTGSSLSTTGQTGAATPKYIRLVKSGKEVSSYISDSKANWQLLGSSRLNFSGSLLVGLAATSGSSTASVAVFDEVEVIASAATAQKSKETMTAKEEMAQGQEEMRFQTHPNPTVNVLNVESEDLGIARISIYDMNGKLMKQQHYKGGKSLEQIEVASLHSGVYIVKLYTDDGQEFDSRFVKE